MANRTFPILPDDNFNQLVPTRHGPMLVNRNDQVIGASLLKYGEYSPGESEIFRQLVLPGTFVVEVGANIGAHTLGLARLVGTNGVVVAYEPQRLIFQTLCANIALKSLANVYAFHAAVGAGSGDVLVPAPNPTQPAHFGGVSLYGASTGEPAPLRRLDEAGLPIVHFLKIDVEGMELDVLNGGEALIAKHRPTLYVNNSREDLSRALIERLWAWDYKLYWHAPTLFHPDNFAGDRENIFGNLVSRNMLCLPAERHVAVEGMTEVTLPDIAVTE